MRISPAGLLMAALLLAGACVPGAPARAACQTKVLELGVTMHGQTPLVHARIDERDVMFIADSGAFFSTMTEATADQLKLRRIGREGVPVYGLGGTEFDQIVRVDRFVLEKSTIESVQFIVNKNSLGDGVAGVLGQNFLGIGDVEYDLANGLIRIVVPNDGCRHADFATWAKDRPVVTVDLERTAARRTLATLAFVKVNGKSVRALFDTGAAISMISLDAAKRAGIDVGAAGVVPGGTVQGFGARLRRTWIVPVESFALGGEIIRDTHLRVADVDLRESDMLIGADYFLAHHIYVANGQGLIYLTYNGGPAFDLSVAPEAAAGAVPASAAPDEANAPTDADGYARRGAAYAARRQYDMAIADLTRACELAPSVAAYFAERGRVQLMIGQRDPARADFDEAIRLDPGDIGARIARAALRVAGQDYAAARADLEAADGAAAEQADVRLQIGNLYERMQMPAAALPQYDRWIAAHEHDVQRPSVLNDRCWARALLGADLQKALDDCDAALDAQPGSAAFLDSRGIVYLRLGRLDKALADFERALGANPRMHWSLYGRGLIRRHNGAIDQGNADIAAAKAIRPTIEDDAKHYGIAL